MKFVLVLVEGPTEEGFVRHVLSPHLQLRGIVATPKTVETSENPYGPNFKGGVTSYQQVRYELLGLLRDTSVVLVTTMLDYFELPKTFPGYDELPAGSCYERVAFLEQRFQVDIGHQRFLSYLSLHEFEALLFASPEQIDAEFSKAEKLSELREIMAAFKSPEEINNEDPPGKRLEALYPGEMGVYRAYKKKTDGPLIAGQIGLATIRAQCRHFDEWLTRLETLGD